MKPKSCRNLSLCDLMVSLFLNLILVDLALSDLSVGPSDVTVNRGQSVLFQCAPGDVNTDLGISWSAYYDNPTVRVQKFFVVQPSKSPDITYTNGTDQTKYVRNGTYNLIVNNVDYSDGAVYGCSSIAGNTIYSNLVVIGDISVSVTPNQNLVLGSQITIQCTVNYGAANVSNSYKPLDPNQDPEIKISIPGRDLLASVSRQPNGIKIGMVNTTVTSDFIGADIACDVTSTANNALYRRTRYTQVSIPAPPKNMQIFTVGNASDLNDVRVDDSINCTAEGYPVPTVRWQAGSSAYSNLASGTYGPGWALLTFGTARESQMWNCTAMNNQTAGIQLARAFTFNVKTRTGQSVTGSAPTTVKGGILLNCAAMVLTMLILLRN